VLLPGKRRQVRDDGEQLCVEAVRQVDRLSMPEDREADSHDESVEQEARQLQTEQIAMFRRNSAIGSEPGQARVRHPALDLAERLDDSRKVL